MVITCAAYGCKNAQDIVKGIPFHRFPFKSPEILKLWIGAVRRDKWTPSRTSRLCGTHFLSSDYLDRPGSTVKLLKPDSVPSVFSFPKNPIPEVTAYGRKIYKHETGTGCVQEEVQPMNVDLPNLPCTSAAEVKMCVDSGIPTSDKRVKTLPRILQRKMNTLKQKKTGTGCVQEEVQPLNVYLPNLPCTLATEVKMCVESETSTSDSKVEILQRKLNILKQKDTGTGVNIGLPNITSMSAAEVKTCVDNGTQTACDKVEILQRKMKVLKQKLKRRDEKISSMKNTINELSKRRSIDDSLDAMLKKHFVGLPLDLMLLQAQKNEGVPPAQLRYSPLVKHFAHTLYFYSPKAYRLLKKHFVLPNARTIRQWLSSLNCEPSVLGEIIDYFRNEIDVSNKLKPNHG